MFRAAGNGPLCGALPGKLTINTPGTVNVSLPLLIVGDLHPPGDRYCGELACVSMGTACTSLPLAAAPILCASRSLPLSHLFVIGPGLVTVKGNGLWRIDTITVEAPNGGLTIEGTPTVPFPFPVRFELNNASCTFCMV